MKNLKQMLEILEKFGEDKSYEAKRITTELINILIRNISEEDLEILARIENIDLLFKIADKTNEDLLIKIAKMYPNDYLQHLIINHKKVSAKVLYEIADLVDIKETRVEIVGNEETVLLRLLRKDCKYFDAIYYIIEDGNVTEEILNQIIQRETDVIERAKKRLKSIRGNL